MIRPPPTDVVAAVREVAAGVFRLPTDEIPVDQSLYELGLDSLRAIELGQELANRFRAAELGITDRLTIEERSFESLTAAWTATFDVVWCQESLCHAADKVAAVAEAFRVLRPGGVTLVSDILVGEHTDAEQLKPFTNHNAVVQLELRERYLEILRQAGFGITAELDWTEHLATNFARMLRQIQEHYDELVAAGVQRQYLDGFANSLRQRTASAADRAFRWGVFVAQKRA